MRRALGGLFFLAGLVLFVFGLSSLGAGVLIREAPLPDGFAWKPPLDQVNNRDLEPATVLLPLTGMPAADALNAALDGGHWENAYALLAYDSSLSDPTRIGAFLQLGTRYAAAQDEAKAAWCYLAAARVATLSPLLSDSVRADTYLQVAAGLRPIGAKDAARLATDQAYLVGQYSPALRRDPQSRRLSQIANAYAALGAEALASQARAQSNEPIPISAEETWLPRDPFVVKAGDLPAATAVNSAVVVRVAAAKQLAKDVAAIPSNHSTDWPQDAVAQLGDALLSEDQARQDYYDSQLAQTKNSGVQVALERERVNWLGLKYRIARGAFGVDLVPEWSRDVPAVGNAWSDAWGGLFRLYEDQASAIPNAQAVSQAMEDVIRQEMLAVRWNWYRGAADTDLHASLVELTSQLQDASVASLRLDAITVNGRTTDLLVPDDLYGKNETALPR